MKYQHNPSNTNLDEPVERDTDPYHVARLEMVGMWKQKCKNLSYLGSFFCSNFKSCVVTSGERVNV